jgi:hypothetical protein
MDPTARPAEPPGRAVVPPLNAGVCRDFGRFVPGTSCKEASAIKIELTTQRETAYGACPPPGQYTPDDPSQDVEESN